MEEFVISIARFRRELARLSAEVTHNHPEGVKGAVATADAIFLCRYYFGGCHGENEQPVNNDPTEFRAFSYAFI